MNLCVVFHQSRESLWQIDQVPRDLTLWFLNKRSAPRGYLNIVKGMYEGVVTGNQLITHIQEEVRWYMWFVDDMMLVAELRDSTNANSQRWRDALNLRDSKGFKITCTKIEYVNCNFSGIYKKMYSSEN